MTCKYEGNPFCSSLSAELRNQLCSGCSFKRYVPGQLISEDLVQSNVFLLVKGVVAATLLDPMTNKPTLCGMSADGTLYSIGDIMDTPDLIAEPDRINICVTNVVIAVFSRDVVHHLYDTSAEFVKRMFENVYLYGLKDISDVMRYVGRGNAYSAVRFVIKFCHDHGVYDLTHEQIALLCCRSRPIVTNILHQLLKNEPELFERPRNP